jgi:hypothetical protein
MITPPRSVSTTLIRLVFFLALVFPLLLIAAQALAADDLLEAFEKAYAEIQNQVKKGKLSGEAGAKANELNIALKKYLIKTEAQLEILQLDALHGSGGDKEAGLNKMVAISAERERIKMGYLQRLLALEGKKSGDKGDMQLLPVVPEQSKADPDDDSAGAEKTSEKNKDKSWKWKDFSVEIGPGNVDSGEP